MATPSASEVRPLPRGRHGLSRAEVAESQRARLLDAMAQAVAESGYANTSVADVVGRAGVSTKAFYEHFRDKEECFLAAYDAGMGVLTRAVGGALLGDGAGAGGGDGASDPVERLDRALGAYLDLLASRPAFARTFLIEVYAAGPRALDRRLAAQQRFVDAFAQAFGPGVDRFACDAFVGAVVSLVTRPVAARRYDELPALREPIVALARRYLL